MIYTIFSAIHHQILSFIAVENGNLSKVVDINIGGKERNNGNQSKVMSYVESVTRGKTNVINKSGFKTLTN